MRLQPIRQPTGGSRCLQDQDPQGDNGDTGWDILQRGGDIRPCARCVLFSARVSSTRQHWSGSPFLRRSACDATALSSLKSGTLLAPKLTLFLTTTTTTVSPPVGTVMNWCLKGEPGGGGGGGTELAKINLCNETRRVVDAHDYRSSIVVSALSFLIRLLPSVHRVGFCPAPPCHS